MNLDRASFSEEIARSFPRHDWEDIGRERNGPTFRDLPLRELADGAGASVHDLTRCPRSTSTGADGALWPAAAAPSSTEGYRLLPRYRLGDRKIEAGRDLFSVGSTGNAIFNLIDGWVALYTQLEDGRRQIVQFALPGAILGVLPSNRSQATFGALALTDVVVSVIPNSMLATLSRDEPELPMRLARSLARDCSLAFDHLTSIGRRSARERVAHLILELFTRYRAQWPGNRIEEMLLPLTQEQIGDATGLTSVHVNRVLSGLRKERIVEFHYRRLRILDPDRLIEVAGVEPEVVTAWLER
ncbi:Crp/Fnr family transcriptional regulator [Bosea thiooxidans]|uniref:Crp/Fnr family transcriptional regulator n=1 Tax=Bosea thiooxidans TaxID=53254 RepID=UPI0012E1A309|nr:Crp/Fnr family transcriptional regulator [Bosea thiooxidans]